MQLASELAIAAIEKNGGVVTTAFYDPRSLGKCSLVGLRKLISISSDQGSMCVIQGSPRSWSQRVVSLSMYSTAPTSEKFKDCFCLFSFISVYTFMSPWRHMHVSAVLEGATKGQL